MRIRYFDTIATSIEIIFVADNLAAATGASDTLAISYFTNILAYSTDQYPVYYSTLTVNFPTLLAPSTYTALTSSLVRS